MPDEKLPQSEVIDELVFAYLEAAEERPEAGPALLDRYCADHPSLAADLRRRVRGLVASGLWQHEGQASPAIPERLGEYRILRRLGEGGMGVVFLAQQESVGRRVALKLIRNAELFSPDARERFLREAQAIARLDHPGIVQVLTVGEAGGMPYFAMEFVAGVPLNRLIEDLRSTEQRSIAGVLVRRVVGEHLEVSDRSQAVDWNEPFFARGWIEMALGIVRDLALALHHAHLRGVLHRDVKSANVILTPEGRVKLLDFGLASLNDAQSITRSGAQIGSLPYMSPEQIDGRTREIAATSDVYSLGVLLFELLSFSMPYKGATYEELRRNVLDARLPSLRGLNHAVSADVETVCAKALELDGARRYASAADFARDLANILELRPIVARPPSNVRRVLRWTQRRPALATAITLGALLLAAGPLGYELNRQRTLKDVRDALGRSERDFRSALSAVGHVLRDMAGEGLEDVPRMQRARLVAVDRAMELFQTLYAERPDDALILAEGGELHRSRGDVLRDLGRPEEALAEFALSTDFMRRRAALSDAPEHKANLAASLHDSGKALHALWRVEEGRVHFKEALELLEAASTAKPENIAWRMQIVNVLLGKVEAQRMGLEDPEGAAVIELARARIEALRAEVPQDGTVAWTAGRTYGEFANAARASGDIAASIEWHAKAIAAFEQAVVLSPESRFFGFDVVAEHCDLATLQHEAGDLAQCEVLVERARELLAPLLRDFPESRRYANQECELDEILAMGYARSGRFPAAIELFEGAVKKREVLLARHSDDTDLVFPAITLHNNLGTAYTEQRERLDLAIRNMERAHELIERLPPVTRGIERIRQQEHIVRYGLALATCLSDAHETALPMIEAATSRAKGAFQLRYATDLWAEYILALRRALPDVAEREELEESARALLLETLGRAIDAGYDDRSELTSNPALATFQDEPEFQAILKRIR